ncbi:TPA: prepilin-type N-terminal cleavage/methylation domain-containing protein [Raoultella planticola]|uniref:prepilin-type N-terminal cleavage/methylation domain-containing protein n=1 Tax=Raoultella planticola TaxID=575 RepID=UPI001A1C6BFB|nr:prepilin-type N-terminal cleavage/methylation domain-containing protein [Raoultella planticola]
MSDAMSHEKGFSLPETLLAMMLLVMVVSALGGYQRGLASGFIQLNQYRQLWRDAWRYGQMTPPEMPPGGSVTRLQTSAARCVSITVTITMPVDKRVQMTRLHCPVSQ